MIGLFDDNGSRLTVTIQAIELNKESDPADDRYEINTIRPSTSLDYVSDPKPEIDGLEVYAPRKVGRLLIVDGIIRAPTIAKLFDKMNSLAGALDPVKLYEANPSTFGFVPLDFTTPSVAGNLACRYYVRPNKVVEPFVLEHPRHTAAYTLELLLRDPRRYLQAQSTLAGGGIAANAGNYKTWPTLTITMSGAGSATYTITNSTTGEGLVLNLTGLVNADVVVVDMEARSIKKNGVDTPALWADGDFFDLEPGNNTILYANTTNAASSLAWRSAFAI